jgi:hypothetical protein
MEPLRGCPCTPKTVCEHFKKHYSENIFDGSCDDPDFLENPVHAVMPQSFFLAAFSCIR